MTTHDSSEFTIVSDGGMTRAVRTSGDVNLEAPQRIQQEMGRDYDTHNGTTVNGNQVTKHGLNKVSASDFRPSGDISYFSDNGAVRISKDNATMSSVVEVAGIRTTLGAAIRIGLISEDGGVQQQTAPQQVKPQAQQSKPQQAEVFGMETPEVTGILNDLTKMSGGNSDFVYTTVTSTIAKLAEGDTEGATKMFNQRFNEIEPEAASELINTMMQGYGEKAFDYISANHKDVDPAVVKVLFDNAPANIKQRIYTDMFQGKGKAALDSLVNMARNLMKQK